MRLSDENARRLTMMIWWERARLWVPIIFGICALIGGLVAITIYQQRRADPVVNVAQHQATVLSVTPGLSRSSAAVLHVHMDDGRDIDAVSRLRVLLAKGSHVQVSDARHASGRHTYDVTGTAN